MKYLIIITAFLLMPNIFFAQMTYVPDDKFEQALYQLGYDDIWQNDSVPTAIIEKVQTLILIEKEINDLTGIDAFKSLEILNCHDNNLKSLDLRNNSALQVLTCSNNNLTSLKVSENSVLQHLDCARNKLISLDLSKNSVLQILDCSDNNLKSLDLRNNSALESLRCIDNDLTSLDISDNSALERLMCFRNNLTILNIKNGNNKNMIGDVFSTYFDARFNPDLKCIQVDDSTGSANAEKWVKDEHAVYSEDCTKVGVEEFNTFEPEISIFPNPADKNFTVSFELETPQTISMTLTDLSGTKLQEFTLENKQYVNEKIDVSQLSSGVYFLNISFGNRKLTKKIVME